MASATMPRGDDVMVHRVDLAEVSGFCCRVKEQFVGVRRQDRRTPTFDVEFVGHETLQRYLPDLFRRVQ